MARQKKEYKPLNIRLEAEISDKLERFCEESGQAKTTAVERILNRFLDEYFTRPETERKTL